MTGKNLVPKDAQLKWLVLNEISRRLIRNFGWSDVMRSFDGALIRYGGTLSSGPWRQLRHFEYLRFRIHQV
jgi:hypothetical protein